MQIAVLILFLLCVFGQVFGYGDQHGPEEDSKRCSGKFQGSIEIVDTNVKNKDFNDLEYFNIDFKPQRVHMTNNGHTILVTMDYEKGRIPRLKGGPMERKSSYQFEHFYFDWGTNNTVGKGDLVNDHAFPGELHVILRSLDFKDLNSALGQDYGIAVLAFYYLVYSDDNPEYTEFLEKLSTISRKGQSVDLEKPMALTKFITKNLLTYYSYNGSLTTPPCAEKVIWMDYQEPIHISEYQINKFRELTAHDDHLKNFYRAPQPIDNRVIYENAPEFPDSATIGYSAIPFVDVANAAHKYSCIGARSFAFVLVTFVINLWLCCLD